MKCGAEEAETLKRGEHSKARDAESIAQKFLTFRHLRRPKDAFKSKELDLGKKSIIQTECSAKKTSLTTPRISTTKLQIGSRTLDRETPQRML